MWSVHINLTSEKLWVLEVSKLSRGRTMGDQVTPVAAIRKSPPLN